MNASDYQSIEREYSGYAQRQRELQARADAGVIVDAEVDELIRIERRLPGVEQRFRDSTVQRDQQQLSDAIDTLIADWGTRPSARCMRN